MSAICEIYRFHPATLRVKILERGCGREVLVCDVHRRIAEQEAESDVGSDTTALSSARNNPFQRIVP